MADLKKVYQAISEEEAMSNLILFKDKWGKTYPSCVKSWEENWDILSTFFAYPPEVRKIIYGKKNYGYDDEVECDRGGTSPQERNPDGVRRNPILGILALCAAASDCVEHLHLHFIWRKGQLDFPGNRFCLCRPNRRNPYRHERRGTLVPYRCTDGVSGSLDKKISSITTSHRHMFKNLLGRTV